MHTCMAGNTDGASSDKTPSQTGLSATLFPPAFPKLSGTHSLSLPNVRPGKPSDRSENRLADDFYQELIMSDILHVTDANFKEAVLDNPLPVVLDFWAPWCGPCRMIAPRLEAAAQTFDGRAVIAKYNVDESNEIAGQFGVRGIPTLMVFKSGELVAQRSGACDQETLNTWIEAAL